jgi:hypothetical protein
MKNIERLLTATPEQVWRIFCDKIGYCDDCPAFISERCDKNENGFLKWLREEDGLGYEDNS